MKTKKARLLCLLLILLSLWQFPVYALRWPVLGYVVSQGYHGDHRAMDFSMATGQAVYAMADGKVVCSTGLDENRPACSHCGLERKPGYSVGMHVTIEHAGGYRVRYHHLSKALVKTGAQVKEGQKIALSGNTGYSTGPHLHLEITKGGSPINPLTLLGPYRKVQAINITETSATLEGLMANYLDTKAAVGNVTEVGCYLGEDKDKMRKVSETDVTHRFPRMWYETATWFGALKPGTTYFYRLYLRYRNQVFSSPVLSFTTQGDYCRVSFHAEGGSVDPASKTVAFGAALGPLPTPIKEGHDFMNWRYGSAIGAKADPSDLAPSAASLTLYAAWRPHVTQIDLSPPAGGLQVGQTQKLIAALRPVAAQGNLLQWSSDRPDILAVDEQGMLTALAPGQATIRVVVADGAAKEASIQVTVHPAILWGDANDNEVLDIGDALSLIDHLVTGQACASMEKANANQEDGIDMADLTWLIDRLQ